MSSTKCLLSFVLLYMGIACPTNTGAANILSFISIPSKSHFFIHCAIADALAQAGHNVTVLGTVPNVYKKAPYTYIHIDGIGFDTTFMNDLISNPRSIYETFGLIARSLVATANETLTHPVVQQFMHANKNSIDLLILGHYMNDFQLGLAAHFKCPVIVSTPIQATSAISGLLGNPVETAYVPTLFGGLRQPMDFIDRVKNYLGNIFEQYVLDSLVQKLNQEVYEYNFPRTVYPSFEALKKNVSLVFTNHHFSQGPIRPNVPGLVEIGGIQIQEQPDPLPSDIAQVLDKATQGAIYFSLGTNIQSDFLSTAKIQLIFKVLSELPYQVLCKWDAKDLINTTSNVISRSWLPQNDILAHPNVKLFITHGGQGSVVESQYHGVPMVGIPFFNDQPANMASVVNAGFGVSLAYATLTEESFRVAILEVLRNPIYSNAVKKFSTLYRDRPMSPRQLVVYWVEYVLRHRGAPHLQSPAVFLNRWQLMSLDVIGLLLLIFLVIIGVLFKMLKCCCSCGNKKPKASHEPKKKFQ